MLLRFMEEMDHNYTTKILEEAELVNRSRSIMEGDPTMLATIIEKIQESTKKINLKTKQMTKIQMKKR